MALTRDNFKYEISSLKLISRSSNLPELARAATLALARWLGDDR
jgi:hypothetical protein